MPTSLTPDALAARTDDALRLVRRTYKGRSWPTVSHLVDAMGYVARNSQQPAIESSAAPSWQIDPVSIAARRMNEGEAVGDDWLYGRNAVRLLQSGLVTRETVRKYRSALYFAAKDQCGESIARTLEEGWIARHAEAEGLAA